MRSKVVGMPPSRISRQAPKADLTYQAGLTMDQCIGSKTAVYTGCFNNDYLSILQQDLEAEQHHAAMGVSPSMLANRLSWFYNFKGTSTNLDSACSSSLVALHLACQDLKAGNCSMVRSHTPGPAARSCR